MRVGIALLLVVLFWIRRQGRPQPSTEWMTADSDVTTDEDY